MDLVRRRQVGLAVADSGDDVEAINGAARELPGIHGPAIGRDLIHHVGRLEQVLLNLPTNAIAYAPRPDRIEAHVGGTRGRESSSRRSTASSTGSRRTRRPSTAARARWTLGLSIAREIVRAHGGPIAARRGTSAGLPITERMRRNHLARRIGSVADVPRACQP